MKTRPHLIPALIVASMLLVAVAPLPYGYYQFLRWAVCGVAVFIAVKSYTWKQTWAIWLFGTVAVMFNPIQPIDLTREIWQPIDLASALLFSLSTLLLPELAAILVSIKKFWQELELWRKVTLTILILVLVGGLAIPIVVYVQEKPTPTPVKSYTPQDNPKYSQREIEALVKKELEEQGVEGHPIDSVGSVRSPQYVGKGVWEGEAVLWFANPFGRTRRTISWAYYERLKILEITDTSRRLEDYVPSGER